MYPWCCVCVPAFRSAVQSLSHLNYDESVDKERYSDIDTGSSTLSSRSRKKSRLSITVATPQEVGEVCVIGRILCIPTARRTFQFPAKFWRSAGGRPQYQARPGWLPDWRTCPPSLWIRYPSRCTMETSSPGDRPPTPGPTFILAAAALRYLPLP